MSDLEASLVQIWEKRRPLIDRRLAAIEQTAQALRSGQQDADTQELAAMEAHNLAGSLGAFGLHKASAAAREAETILRNPSLAASDADHLLHLTSTLRQLIDQGPESA